MSPDAVVPGAGSARGVRRAGLIGSAVAVLLLMVGLFSGLAPSASAAGAQVNQCNGVYNTGGQEIRCRVIINNTLNLATGVSSSTGTIQECHGPAGTALLCTTTPVVVLSTVVNQCNFSALGGGAVVTCSVQVTNTITGNGSTSPATVDQCIGSGAEGPEPTTQCNPTQSTTNADITQCNGSANGGGAARRVKCTVTASTSSGAVPVKINQCNNSAAGGSLVTCSAQIINRFVTVPPPTTTTGPTATSTRPRPSGTVRPTIVTRPSSSASVTTTARSTSSSTSGRTTTATSGNTSSRASSTSTNGVATATTSSSSTTTALASTGVPAGRQALLAVVLLSAGAALMLIGRRPRWIGKHR